jgi:two-component system, sensor histidine kinase PdtaS
MIAEGSFPFEARRSAATVAPRVGDGVMVVDAEARVQYASPNAVSALHRVGISANVVGQRLAELGFNDASVRQAFERHEPVMEEFDQSAAVTLLVRCIPIMAAGAVTGGVLLLRDVSELRQRDRLLLSKDATIREIHHRVKNNLQTISSLLRLQSRRTTSDEARAVLAEAVRRIRTIALVHETLSREASDDVAFVEIVRPLLRLAEDSLQSPDRPVRFRVEGDGGKLPAGIATPLAVVLTELLQNAVAHAFVDRSRPGHVVVLLEHDEQELTVKVVDDGVGVAEDFSIDSASSLGLTIVRSLVTTELAGEIAIRAGTPADHQRASLEPPLQGTGTTVVVRVPMHLEV